MKEVVIIGAGLSGLAAAYRLRQRSPDLRISVLERRTRIGGNIWTEYQDGFTLEHGPNGFLDGKPSTKQLCTDLGIARELLPGSDAARKFRYLYLNGQLQCLPGDPWGLLRTKVLSWRGKLAMLTEPFRRRGNARGESIAEFARRRFGKEAADVFIDALVTGIYAGDPEQLGVAACFPRLVQMEHSSCSVFKGFLKSSRLKRLQAEARGEKPSPQRMWSFPRGLRVLVENLQEQSRSSIHTGVEVRSIRREGSRWRVQAAGQDFWLADAVIDTSPAYAQAEHLAETAPSISSRLQEIRFNRIVVALLGYRQSDTKQPDGFGYIAPQNTRRDVLGVQWCSSIYPGHRAPPGIVLWRALCGGVQRAELVDLSDDAILKIIHTEMQLSTGVSAPPVFTKVVRWPRAIPQYDTQHLDRVSSIEAELARLPGLFLGGNSLRGVAMNDCTEQAVVLADQTLARLRANPG